MKTASESVKKFVERAGAASGDYGEGAQNTSKDQSALAVAAQANLLAAITASITSGRWAKNLQGAGKGKWLKGILEKGVNRFAEGVSAGAADYAANSGRYDSARNSASSMPRGPKGSEQNYARAKTVGQNLRKQKVGV
jgi:hypothetical protein